MEAAVQEEKKKVEISQEASEKFAYHFNLLKIAMHTIDWDYAVEVVKFLRERADFLDTTAALNRGYTPIRSQIMRAQSDGLRKMIQARDLLIIADKGKLEAAAEEEMHEELAKMFA